MLRPEAGPLGIIFSFRVMPTTTPSISSQQGLLNLVAVLLLATPGALPAIPAAH